MATQTKRERTFRPFTPEELTIIRDSNKKMTLADLALKLNINYTNLSSALKYHRVVFNPLFTPRHIPKKEPVKMTKKVNSENEELLTDELMTAWFR